MGGRWRECNKSVTAENPRTVGTLSTRYGQGGTRGLYTVPTYRYTYLAGRERDPGKETTMSPMNRTRREVASRVDDLGLDVRWIDPREMSPAHPAHDDERLAELVESMDEDGWVGVPLLAEGSYSAMTGSHRIEAARRVGLDAVPVVDADEAIRALGADPDDYRMGNGRLDTDALWKVDGLERFGVEF